MKRPRRVKISVLAMAGVVFVLHMLGLLVPMVLVVSGLAAAGAALGLVMDIPGVRARIRKVLNGKEVMRDEHKK